MKHGSLFSGIGGFDLAAEWMGWENVFHVERQPFCQAVLKKHFPQSRGFDDVTKFDGKPWRGTIDILTGGFPCQPFSVAGKRRGKDDDRALWPEMLRIISEIRPNWIVGENVAGFINLGLDDCISDLEAEGYETTVFVLPACAVAAPHRRDRVWIIAKQVHDSNSNCESRSTKQKLKLKRAEDNNGSDKRIFQNTGRKLQSGAIISDADADADEDGDRTSNFLERSNSPSFANANATGRERCEQSKTPRQGKRPPRPITQFDKNENWIETATRVCSRHDGLPQRMARFKSIGNAIVPQIAYEIFKAIEIVK